MDLGKLKLGEDANITLKLEAGKLVAVFELDALKELKMLIDKIEVMIPGDQTGIAIAVKAILEAQLK